MFLIMATCMLVASAFTLLFPGTFVDRIWDIKRSEYEQLLRSAPWSGVGFLVLGIVMAMAAYGWFNVRRWAWWLVQGIFMVNMLGDVGRAISGDVVGGLVGVALVSALLVYVRGEGVSAVFAGRSSSRTYHGP